MEKARVALERAGGYFRDRLGVQGSYVWKYSVDGRVRRGEGGAVGVSTGWVQPPGTPAVGAAFLRIHEVIGGDEWLAAADMVSEALLQTQLASGGWAKSIEMDPEKAGLWCYRTRIKDISDCKDTRNASQLDDNNTQSALNFLIWFDQASGGTKPEVREAVDFGLRRLIDVQYKNGAVPVTFEQSAPAADKKTAQRATMPAEWPREWQKPDSPPYFVINDNVMRDTGRLFLNAFRTYRRPEYLRSAMRIGDFLVAAQLPAPQQGWAQLYNHMLQPVWGRKFEPPSVASSETAGCIEYLLELYGQTHKRQYFEAATSAAEWLKAARLDDGTWARFYEIGTGKPIYVDKDYRITYDDSDLPDHYGMKGVFAIPAALDRLASGTAGAPAGPKYWVSPVDELTQAELAQEAARLIQGQDAQGRWIEDKWIDGRQFVDGVLTLARFISSAQAAEADVEPMLGLE